MNVSPLSDRSRKGLRPDLLQYPPIHNKSRVRNTYHVRDSGPTCYSNEWSVNRRAVAAPGVAPPRCTRDRSEGRARGRGQGLLGLEGEAECSDEQEEHQQGSLWAQGEAARDQGAHGGWWWRRGGEGAERLIKINIRVLRFKFPAVKGRPGRRSSMGRS